MKDTRTLIVGNWKLNPTTLSEAKKLFLTIKESAQKASRIETIVCPPAAYISELSHLYKGTKLVLGGQDISAERLGAYTGQISATMLRSVGAKWVIIGHSEVRMRGDTNALVGKKVRAALAEDLKVIVCIGESKRDHDGEYFTFLRDELKAVFDGVSRKDLERLTIAYEPIWAIGGRAENAMTPQQLHEMVIFIRKELTHRYDHKTALDVRILYGGSVKIDNAAVLLVEGFVDGLLVGGASIVPEEFGTIIAAAQEKK